MNAAVNIAPKPKALKGSIYTITPWSKNESHEASSHENHKKKATNPVWYKKEFKTLKTRQEGLLYSATYKVSKKLLAR